MIVPHPNLSAKVMAPLWQYFSLRASDGRPDPRPSVRENMAILGDLALDFDFAQKPRPPMLLPVHPPFRGPGGEPVP